MWKLVQIEGLKGTFPCLMRGNHSISTSQEKKSFEKPQPVGITWEKKKREKKKNSFSLFFFSPSRSLCTSPPFFLATSLEKLAVSPLIALSLSLSHPNAMKLISFSLVIPFSLLVSNSLSLQRMIISRSTTFGHVTMTRVGRDFSKEVVWSVPSSVEAGSQWWRIVQRVWPRHGMPQLHCRLRPHPPPVQGPNKFLLTSSS